MNTVDSYIPRSSVSRAIAGSRLLVGLLQGLALFLIYQAAENKLWTTGNSGLFAALLLACTIVPVLLVSALGYFPYRTLWRWLLFQAPNSTPMGRLLARDEKWGT